MDADDPAYKDLIALESVPPLPATAAALLNLAADADVEIADLAMVIQRDPGLTARVIGIANSAFYAPRYPVMTVKDAIVRVLGLNLVRNMTFGMALVGSLSTAACPRFNLTEYWLIALGTADLAGGLARASTAPRAIDPDAAYLVGLLHNLGEVLLAHLWPRQMDEALRQAAGESPVDLVRAERAEMGVDHWAAGALLARHWQLPPIVGNGIECLGDPIGSADDAPLTQLLRAARRWVVGVVAGRSDTLRVEGIDGAYCDYRASAFLSRYDALASLAESLGR